MQPTFPAQPEREPIDSRCKPDVTKRNGALSHDRLPGFISAVSLPDVTRDITAASTPHNSGGNEAPPATTLDHIDHCSGCSGVAGGCQSDARQTDIFQWLATHPITAHPLPFPNATVWEAMSREALRRAGES